MDLADSYLLWNHRRVKGWVDRGALALVKDLTHAQHQRGIRGAIAEIGVHHGRFFIALHLLRAADEASVAIDLFADQGHNRDSSGQGDESIFRKNLRMYAGGDELVTVVQGDSTLLTATDVQQLADGCVRMFSVDGGHIAQLVEHDMRTAGASLVSGGIVIGDDVFNMGWPGVVEGTLNYLHSVENIVPFAIGYNKVFFAAPEYADDYRAVVMKTARHRFWNHKESVFGGQPVAIVWATTPRSVAKRLLRHE